MSERCFKCFKPVQNCLCKYTSQIDSGIKFVFLMHPKEAKRQRTGTGRLSHICLKDSEIIVGLDFCKNQRLSELLNDSQYFPMLMYPDKNSRNVFEKDFCDFLFEKKLLVLILDATWFCSRKMIEKNPFLLELPRLSFKNHYESIFTFKREPNPECISTIECCYYLINEMKSARIINQDVNPEPLMRVFKQMIKFQLQAENERIMGLRPDTHDYDKKYNKIRKIPEFL